MSQSETFKIENFLPYILTQAAEAVSYDFQDFYKKKYGILRTEWRVLFHLGNSGELTAKDICVKAKTHKTKISRAVFRLEKNKLLIRVSSQKDRRQEFLSLTKAGKAIYTDLKKEAQMFEERVTKNFTRKEMEVLKVCLARIESHFS